MPFRFKKSESTGKAVRRVGGERVRAALKWLEKARRPAAIHNVRKEIKKLRALLRLVRGEIGDDYRRSMKPLRRAAEQLAATRDARVIFRALENLVEGSGGRFQKLHKFLRKNWRRETRRLREGNSVPKAELCLRKTGRRLQQLEFKVDGWLPVAPGLKQSYERGRNALGLALREPSPENFHAWRKHVKTFWYQLQLVCPKPSPEMRAFIGQMERLGEQLGVEHDLALLKQFLAGRGGDAADDAVKVGKLIQGRQQKLRQAALKLGGQLFAEDPGAVCQRLEKHWRNCRGD